MNEADAFRRHMVDSLKTLKNPDGSWGEITKVVKDFINGSYKEFIKKGQNEDNKAKKTLE